MAFVGILFLSDGLGHWLIKYLGIKKHMVFALALLICIHDVVASHISDHYADQLPLGTAMDEELNVSDGIHE